MAWLYDPGGREGGWMGLALLLVLRLSETARRRRPISTSAKKVITWEGLLHTLWKDWLPRCLPQSLPKLTYPPWVHPIFHAHPFRTDTADDRSHTFLGPQGLIVVAPPSNPSVSGGCGAFPLEDGPLPIGVGTLHFLTPQGVYPRLCAQPTLDWHSSTI